MTKVLHTLLPVLIASLSATAFAQGQSDETIEEIQEMINKTAEI